MTTFRQIFFFNDPATTEIYTLSLHDALPICTAAPSTRWAVRTRRTRRRSARPRPCSCWPAARARTTSATCPSSCAAARSEEHTSELQSRQHLVCRLLLEKKKNVTPLSPLLCS